jgi:hypothetical protein
MIPMARFELLAALVTTLLTAALMSPLARGEIEFVGILATSQSSHFALADTTTGRTEWVMQGNSFNGYTVGEYERKDDTLVLRRGGTERRIRLKEDAKIKSARLELTGTMTFGATDRIEIERATLFFDEENVFPAQNGVTYRITPRRQPDGTIRYTAEIERVLAPNKIERLSSPAVVTLPGQQFSMRIDDLGFSFKPR